MSLVKPSEPPAPVVSAIPAPSESQDLRISRKELHRLHALASGHDGATLLGISAANALLLHEIARHLSRVSTGNK